MNQHLHNFRFVESELVKCLGCGERATHQLSLMPAVHNYLYFCDRCFSVAQHAFDPVMVESRILLIAERDAAIKAVGRLKDEAVLRDKELNDVKQELNDAAEVLYFYADPGTYFAIGFFPDRPCGDFMEDFSETHLGMKPGKRARDLFQKYIKKDDAHGNPKEENEKTQQGG